MAAASLFVQRFPGPDRRRKIASPGRYPEWRADGKEIVYVDADGVSSVSVARVGDDLQFGTPNRLFEAAFRPPAGVPLFTARWLAVSRDGSRIFYTQRIEQPEANIIHVKTQWAGNR
jgi:hypothetical protein